MSNFFENQSSLVIKVTDRLIDHIIRKVLG